MNYPIFRFWYSNNENKSMQCHVYAIFGQPKTYWLWLKLNPINTRELWSQTRGSETFFPLFFLYSPKQAEVIKHLSSEKKHSHWKLVWFKDLLSDLTHRGLSIWVSRFYISNKALIAKVTDHLIEPRNKSALSAGWAEKTETKRNIHIFLFKRVLCIVAE